MNIRKNNEMKLSFIMPSAISLFTVASSEDGRGDGRHEAKMSFIEMVR